MAYVILLLTMTLQLFETMILLYILMSWIPESRETQIGRVLKMIVEPYLSIFRNIIPPLGMIDISPILAYFVLRLATIGLENFL